MFSGKFIEGVGGKLAERWVATLLTPAFCFWAGGLLAWVHRFGWSNIEARLASLSEPVQIGVLIAALLAVAASAVAAQKFDLAILRWLEGYWPRPLHRPRHWLVQRQQRQRKRIKDRLQVLMQQPPTSDAQADELEEEKARLDYQRHWLPSRAMPTRLGNILRAAELRPKNYYGLDAVVCWPHLWLLLPEHARTELQAARADLNTAARVWLWSVLFLLWSFLSLWAAIAGLLCALWAYRWALAAARTYGDLLTAAFDLYRGRLYTSLRWPLPATSEEEKKMGEQLTQYLWRGPIRPITYAPAKGASGE